MRYILACILMLAPVAVFAGTATLDWTDNATNEVGYEIERAPAACSPAPTNFAKVGEAGVNAKSYVDTVPDGYQYCWRVRAYNYKWVGSTNPADRQFSAYSNLAGKDFLLPAAAAPTGLTAN